MSIQASVCTILAGNSEVAALVGDRVRPEQADQKDKRPFVVVRASEKPWTHTGSGVAKAGEARVDVFAVSETSEAEASQIAAAAMAALMKFRGAAGDRRFEAIWEDETDPNLRPLVAGDDQHDWWTVNITVTVHWKRVTS